MHIFLEDDDSDEDEDDDDNQLIPNIFTSTG